MNDLKQKKKGRETETKMGDRERVRDSDRGT